MNILYNGYEFQRAFYCKDCQQMKCTIGRLICDDCNEIRKQKADDEADQTADAKLGTKSGSPL